MATKIRFQQFRVGQKMANVCVNFVPDS